jgi:Group II intron, maturase-specific domain
MPATNKPFNITKKQVYEAYKAVKSNAGAAGAALQARLAACHLELHPTKTKIVYCKDGKRKGVYPTVKFDFLGFCFRPRLVKRARDGKLFCGFNPAVSPVALKSMRATIKDLGLRRRTEVSLADIARRINPLLRGVDQLLRTIRAIGARSLAPICQPNTSGMGDAEVQTLQSSQSPCGTLS